MSNRLSPPRRMLDFILILLCLAVLFPCLYFPYAAFRPDLGFDLAESDWKVVVNAPCKHQPEQCLKMGDQILRIADYDHHRFSRSRRLSMASLFGRRLEARVELIRDGQHLVRNIKLDGGHLQTKFLVFSLSYPLIFWLMGTIAIIFLRPRDERWLVFVLFCYLTALWIVSGMATRVANSSVVFHAVIWFFLPLAVHLHTVLPDRFLRFRGRARAALLATLYGSALVLAVLDSQLLVPSWWPVVFTIAGVVLSILLLSLRLVLSKDTAVRVAARIMLYGVTLGLGPFLLLNGVFNPVFQRLLINGWNLTWFYPYMQGIALISMPILPMSYIYAIYKHHLGALEFRANRLLGIYSFSALLFATFTMTFFFLSGQWNSVPGDFLATTLVLSLVFIAATPMLRDRFQGFVDRHVFGIKHTAQDVIGIVSSRIPSAFDREVLARVIANEILPTLLIRQSTLYLFGEGRKETLYEQAVPSGEPEPTMEELLDLLKNGGRYLLPREGDRSPRAWVRLVIPLIVQAQPIGVWLIGRRDPDDYFPASDIELLSTVANQIAPMAENVRLYEKAQQEIAQRRAAEEEIRRSEERFRTLFEATLEGIAIVRNGVILEVNKALLAIFGFHSDEILGRPLAELVAGDVDLAGVPRESLGFKSDRSPVNIEVAGKRYLFQGEEVSVVAIRDIAQRKRDEAENKMLQRQLLHSQKMEAIGRLSAGVAHDFNNCLLAIFGYSDLLLERYGDDAFLARNLTGIKEAGQRAAALTKQLLAFARRQPMETRVMSLNPVISELEKMLQRLLGEDIQLVTQLHPDLAKVKIDPGQIEQVIVNLAVNARHAMPAGGRLTLRTLSLDVRDGGPAPHANVPPGSYVLLTVTDTGSGMDAATQARVFEPFFSTKGEGTGLGLSTAYGIVRQSGGHIFVNSAPGEGACFSLYLPVTREAETVRGGAMAGSSDRGSETILLVEDEDEVRTVLNQILVSKGYRVLQASSGEEALILSRLHRGAVHLLLTDVTMPEMKGPELAQRLRAERPQTRVVFMSGYNDEQLSDGGPASPVCLQKPFSPQVLGEALRAALDVAAELRAAG
jgi:signal transduction histidine kinase